MSDPNLAAYHPEVQPLSTQPTPPEPLQARILELEQQLRTCHEKLQHANAVIKDYEQAAVDLRTQAEKFRFALDLNQLAIWDWDLQTGAVTWNDSHFYLLGYRPGEIVQAYEAWRDRVHPDDRERTEQSAQQAIETGTEYQAEYRVICPDGSIRWLMGKGRGIYNADGQPFRMIGIGMDISDRKATEIALRRSEEQHRLTLELTHIGCWVWELATDEVKWNGNHFRLLGYVPDEAEVHYQMWRDRVHPEDIDRVEALQSHALQTRTDYTAEYRVIHPDGSLHWMMSRGRGVYDASGKAHQIVGVIIDISDRKQAEIAVRQLNQELESRVEERTAQLERVNQQLQAKIAEHECTEAALRQSEERLRLALEAAHMGVWEVDLATGQQTWSAQSEQLFGFEPGTFNGTRTAFLSRVHPDDQEELAAQSTQALQTGDFTAEYRVVYPNQTIHWIAARGRVFLDQAGNPLRMSGVDLDISDRKQSEEQIRSALNEKEVLLKEIHHRVKNNLQIISSLLRMQARQTLHSSTATLFQEAQNRVQSMALIHEQLYQSPDLSHIQFGRYVRVLVNQLFQCYGVSPERITLAIEADEMPLNLNTAIPCGLIVNELVTNALKHAFPDNQHGSITLQLKIAPDPNHAAIQQGILTVADDGIGIPPDLNWQTSPSLGLRIVRNLVKQICGELTIQHQTGTTFCITFPCPSRCSSSAS
ncbi:PAS domain-containing sensor histidine kinase [Egbenema bharatensis]|uniref:PAS domain-containing sensor histidine kinase n=1 Tax=Egbenema bharatensis TaxID=3463334 RepID=UPI003A85BF4A